MAKFFCSKVCCVAKYSSIDFLLTAMIKVRMFKTSFRYSMTILACASNPTLSRSWQTTSYDSSLNSFDKVSTSRFTMHRFIDPSFGVIFFNFINAQNNFLWTLITRAWCFTWISYVTDPSAMTPVSTYQSWKSGQPYFLYKIFR